MQQLHAEGLEHGSFGLTEAELRHHLNPLNVNELRELIKQDLHGRRRLAEFLPENAKERPRSPNGDTATNGAGQRKPNAATPLVFTLTPFKWRAPATIPTRQWLYNRHLIRGFVSSTTAPGGSGKSSLALVEAVAMASGRNLLGPAPLKKLRIWYWGEDPLDEIERRVAAIFLHYGIRREEIEGHLFIDSGRNREIALAVSDRNGFRIAEPMAEALRQAFKANAVDVAIIDPFVSTHRVTENDNVAIDAVVKTWTSIGDATGCAIELIHHVRKTGGAEITAEDARGAIALRDAARSVRILNPMTKEEAEQTNVDNRRVYFRANNGKANLYLPPDKSEWFRLVSVSLRNGQDGPSDEVGVPTSWEWPNAFDGISIDDLRRVQVKIAEGEWAENCQAKDWARIAVGDALGLDPSDKADRARIKALIKVWVKNKVLWIETQHSTRDGRDRPMIVVGERA